MDKKKKEKKRKVQVHRIQFIEWMPSPITSMAFSKVQPNLIENEIYNAKERGNLLAIGRENGNIEIWNKESGFHRERVIPGHERIAPRAIVWLSNGKLFSGTLYGNIIEWNINSLSIIKTYDSFGGAVWCLGAAFNVPFIAVGCEDGALRLFDASEEILTLKKTFLKQEGRILSVRFHPNDEDIFSGGSDGTIRRFNIKTGNSLFAIKVENMGNPTATLIWSLEVFTDFTVVHGDSLGHVQIWDGKFGTLIQSFKEHQSDILCVAKSGDEKRIFASGINSKVSIFELITTSNGEQKWVHSTNIRTHSHDVSCLVVQDNLLYSGSFDCRFCIYPDNNINQSSYIKISPYPHRPLFSLSSNLRSLFYQSNKGIQIWHLGESKEYSFETKNLVQIQIGDGVISPHAPNGTQLSLSESYSFSLDIKTKGNFLNCFATSPDGSLVACANVSSIKLFRLYFNSNSQTQVKKLKFPSIPGFATGLLFSSNSQKLYVSTNTFEIHELDLTNQTLTRTFAFHQTTKKPSPIVTLATSMDGNWLASGDLNNNIFIISLATGRIHFTLPIFNYFHSTFTFSSDSKFLIIGLTNNQLFIFDIETKSPTSWSEKNQEIPHLIAKKDKILGIVSLKHNPSLFFVYGLGFLFLIDTQKDNTEPDMIKYFESFSSIMYFDCLNEKELVVVERPWSKIVTQFPPTFHRLRYNAK